MEIHKFGGASIKDVSALKNLQKVLEKINIKKKSACVVVSAMGKTTNNLEHIYAEILKGKSAKQKIESLKQYHFKIIRSLCNTHNQKLLKTFIDQQLNFSKLSKKIVGNSDVLYSYIVSKGELISTKIVSAFLNEKSIPNTWIDAREYIITEKHVTSSSVNFKNTKKALKKLKRNTLYIIGGFIGSNQKKQTTTLGREGSDYSAAVLAYCLNAKNITIWKDVPGVLTADPKKFSRVKKIDRLTYQESIELSYYGASVIHPKTIQPLKIKEIPLFVKPFDKPTLKGTIISSQKSLKKHTSYIEKSNQIFLILTLKNFSFINENYLSIIYNYFETHKIKLNLSQHSAVSFYAVIDPVYSLDALIDELDFLNTKVIKKTTLFTMHHPKAKAISKLKGNNKVLLEQKSGDFYRFLVKS